MKHRHYDVVRYSAHTLPNKRSHRVIDIRTMHFAAGFKAVRAKTRVLRAFCDFRLVVLLNPYVRFERVVRYIPVNQGVSYG